MDLCTNLPGSLCSKPIDLTNVGSLNVICWDQFLRFVCCFLVKFLRFIDCFKYLALNLYSIVNLMIFEFWTCFRITNFRLTRLDDDTDWHDQFLARTYSEEEFMRKRKENVKKRSKSDTSTRHLPQQANFFPNKSAAASPAVSVQ